MPPKKLITAPVKITQLDSKKLKHIAETYNTSMSKMVQNWIRDEYKRIQKVEKDGYEIL